MKHILITGAGGQLGREMQALAADHPDFTYDFTDAATLDVTDRGAVDEWFATHTVDFVVNCAAYTAVDRAESDREACHRLNALAPGCLADAARRNGADEGDEVGRADVQLARRRADRAHFARARRDGRARRFGEDDAVAFQIDLRFGGAEVDREAHHRTGTPHAISWSRMTSSGRPTTFV